MPVNLRDFMNAMNEWTRQEAPPGVQEVLPASMWMKVRYAGADVDGGVRFDPRAIVDVALDGRTELLDSVAEPLARALNERFAPKDAAPSTTRRAIPPVPPPPAPKSAPGPAPASSAADPSLRRDLGWRGRWQPEPEPEPEPAHKPEPAPEPVHKPEPEPAPAPAPEPEPEPAEHGYSFPAYDYSRDDLDFAEEDGPHVPVGVERFDDRLRYSWPDAGEGEVYRVVVSDLEDPYSPDDFEELAVTEGTEAWDTASATTAVRFVTVWAYARSSGGSLGQCRRIASRVIVHDLHQWELEFDSESGAVIGSWTPPVAPPGAQVTVRSARLPVDRPPGRFLKGSAWMSFEVSNNGSGFQDAQVVGGKRYNYVAAVEVSLNGRTHASKPVMRSITPTVVVERIKDVAAVEVPPSDPSRPSSLTITWTQSPQTTVVLYRTREPVDEQARSRNDIPESQLAAARLPEEARLNSRLAAVDESDDPARVLHTLANVPWPAGPEWDTLHLTPVTLHSGDRATIGAPLRLKRAGGVSNATLTRRLTWDLVTFTWPGDAAAVELRCTTAEQEPDRRQPPLVSVTKEEYQANGGCVLERGLPAAGGRLHLNSLTYLEGRQIPSPVVSLDVPPRWVYRYTLVWPGDTAPVRGLGRLAASILKQTLVEVRITPVQGFTDPDYGVGLVLLHNPSRLPLSPDDGQAVPLYRQRPTKEGGQESSLVVPLPPQGQNLSLWFDHSGLSGYLRLSVNSSASSQIEQEYDRRALEHYALIDPELSVLHRQR